MLSRRTCFSAAVVAVLAITVLLLTLNAHEPRALAHAPHTGLDFSMEVDTDGDTINDCGTRDDQLHSCTVALNAAFRSREYLNSIGDIPSFRGMQLHFGFAGGVAPASDPDSVWPGCAAESFYFETNFGHASCGVAGSSPSISYTGLVASIFYKCSADGTVDLMHGINVFVHTHLAEAGLTRHAEGEQTSEVLTVTCEAPQPYPIDTDGDGCPDDHEASLNELAGGRRNFFDPWDYFNPTGDGVNRIDDVLAVALQYFVDEDDAGYTSFTDRTAFGPNAWNLGPPNGQQRVDDILAAVRSYFHDCS